MRVLAAFAALLSIFYASGAQAGSFDRTLEAARGQTVYFNAWGGSSQINDYLRWVGEQLEARYGIELVHVKLTDTSDAVARVRAEKEAGRSDGGSIDLVWINGENFRAMREDDLLFGPFAQDLPNMALVDTEANPTATIDFTVPTEGYESPWGMARFVMIHDQAATPEPPATIRELAAWVHAHPGRFAYPAPPDFIGTTFLKHVLIATVGDDVDLSQPPGPDGEAVIEPTLAWLEALQPDLWRGGASFPPSGPALHRLLEDGEVDFSMAFNPSEAASLVLSDRLPETTRSYAFKDGTIANSHFLAIPFNASSKEAAMVTANFLLSPEAQAKKQDPSGWGDSTVLALDRLPPADAALFDTIEWHPASLPRDTSAPVLNEPHPDWTGLLEQAWAARLGH